MAKAARGELGDLGEDPWLSRGLHGRTPGLAARLLQTLLERRLAVDAEKHVDPRALAGPFEFLEIRCREENARIKVENVP